MPVDYTALNAEIQTLADKYQVHIAGKATPVNPDEDDFDITVTAVVPTAPSTPDASSTVSDASAAE